MKLFQYAVFGALGTLVGGLLVAAVVNPPSGPTSPPRARFVSAFQTDAGGFDMHGGLYGVTRGLRPATVGSLAKAFPEMSYDLDSVGSGGAEVPRLFVANLPLDIGALSEEEARKAVFFKVVLPLVLYANEEILADRNRLWQVRYQLRQGGRLSALDRLWLMITTEKYQVSSEDLGELARRLDVVPPSLALAQAAMESGWGTNGLVRQTNALFGRTESAHGGMVTSQKLTVGVSLESPDFDNLLDSVRAYMHNLNSHAAYGEFRYSRAQMRNAGAPVDGVLLLPKLENYSEQGKAYTDSIETIIETNRLRRLDDARLQYAPAIARPAA